MRARLFTFVEAKGRLIRTPELFLTVQQSLGLNVTLARPSGDQDHGERCGILLALVFAPCGLTISEVRSTGKTAIGPEAETRSS